MKKIIISSLFLLGSFFIKGYSQSPAEDTRGVTCIVTTDKQIYTVGENVAITFTLINTGSSPVTIGFSSSCKFDYYIDFAYHYLQGMVCLPFYTQIVLNPGGIYSKTYIHHSYQYALSAGYHEITGVSQSTPSYYGYSSIQVTNQLPAIQTLVIPAGWSGISSYLNPANPSLVSLMAPVVNNLEIIMNSSNTYSPPQGIMPTAPWNTSSGYFIKMDQPVQLNFNGFELQNKTINLSAGWNLIPVLTICDHPVEVIMSGINFEIVQQVAGTGVYWPSQGVQSLQLLEHGKSYLIKMNGAGSITFPGCD